MYAVGKRAWGHCERCGDRYLLRELRFDGQQEDLLVCPPCWDPKHPQERLPEVTDPVTLQDPTGDTEKSIANLQAIDYPPFVDGVQQPMVIRIGVLLRPSALEVELPTELPPAPVHVATMDLLGLPGTT